MDFVRASDGHEVKSRMTHYVAPVVKSPPKSIQMTIMERILSRTNSSVRAIRILAWICRLLRNKIKRRGSSEGAPAVRIGGSLSTEEISKPESTFIRFARETENRL